MIPKQVAHCEKLETNPPAGDFSRCPWKESFQIPVSLSSILGPWEWNEWASPNLTTSHFLQFSIAGICSLIN